MPTDCVCSPQAQPPLTPLLFQVRLVQALHNTIVPEEGGPGAAITGYVLADVVSGAKDLMHKTEIAAAHMHDCKTRAGVLQDRQLQVRNAVPVVSDAPAYKYDE
jgi:hypothetical protein